MHVRRNSSIHIMTACVTTTTHIGITTTTTTVRGYTTTVRDVLEVVVVVLMA